jgi:L-asparaginase/Glu-tRNA(Gln) amidotransferase subunit D
MVTNIYVMQMIPGFDDSSLLAFAKNADDRRKGLVLALYGAGNAPTRRKGYFFFSF